MSEVEVSDASNPYDSPSARIVDASMPSAPDTRWRWLVYPLGLACMLPAATIALAAYLFGSNELDFVPSEGRAALHLAIGYTFLGSTTISGLLLLAKRNASIWALACAGVAAILTGVMSGDWEVSLVLAAAVGVVFAIALWLRRRGVLR